jgi:hypothetical protein
LDPEARWHILTYDQLSVRTEIWQIADEREEKAIRAARPDLAEQIKKPAKYPKKLKIDQWGSVTPGFEDAKRVETWQRKMRRLKGELLEQILAAGPILTIVDEAHRAKNRDAKRAKAVQCITATESKVLLLTGTPLRNNEHEAAVLLGYLDINAGSELSKDKGYSIEDVKDYLGYFMIRRTKTEILPELPPKTRQRVDIDRLDADALLDYTSALDFARRLHTDAIADGASEAEARQAMQGAVEKARTALGLAKVRGGDVADLVAGVVESKGCCVVFCAHNQVSDELLSQLARAGLKCAVVDGRTAQAERARIETDFQSGNIEVFIGGINSAGEAITLTRSDTVVLAELDWVPAALLQAEDRIHRVGQKANCQVIQLIARFSGDNLDEEIIGILGSKLERIGKVLGESTGNIIEGQGSFKNEVLDRLLCRSSESCAREGHNSVPARSSPSDLKPGPGRPRLADDERKRRRAISKRVWRQANIEKQREYHNRWKKNSSL